MRSALLLMVLAGCTRGGDDTGPTLDTGWWSELGDTGGCVDKVSETRPEAGEQEWYWRSNPWAMASDAYEEVFEEAYEIRPADDFAAEAPASMDWQQHQLNLELDIPLQPDSDYVFEVTDCDGKEQVPFHTSDYGLPLDVPPAGLQERAYAYDMTQADWTEPPNFGPVIALYFTRPVLIGVQWASDSTIDLIGSMGFLDTQGEFRQTLTLPTWNLPATSFGEAPYFEAHAEQITVLAEGIEIDIYDFDISGTFSADGTSVGGTRISGLGDTRNMGELIGRKGEPAAMCELAATWSVECTACPDGSSYCMRLTASEGEGQWIQDLSIRFVAE